MLDVHIQRIGECDEISGCQISYISLAQLYALDLPGVNARLIGQLCLRHTGHAAIPLQLGNCSIVAIAAVIDKRAKGAIAVVTLAVSIFFTHTDTHPLNLYPQDGTGGAGRGEQHSTHPQSSNR